MEMCTISGLKDASFWAGTKIFLAAFTITVPIAPDTAAAQGAPDTNLDAKHCFSGGQSNSGKYFFQNICSTPVKIRYCIAINKSCEEQSQFAYLDMQPYQQFYPSTPEGEFPIYYKMCSQDADIKWSGGEPYSSIKSYYFCDRNAATIQKESEAAKKARDAQFAGAHWKAVAVDHPASGKKCVVLMNYGAFGLDKTGKFHIELDDYANGETISIKWTGSCDTNSLISGNGRLVFYLIHDDGFEDYLAFDGLADRGVLQGTTKITAIGGQQVEYGPVIFASGCNNWLNSRPDMCRPATSNTLRQKYLDQLTLSTKPSAPPTQSALPMPPAVQNKPEQILAAPKAVVQPAATTAGPKAAATAAPTPATEAVYQQQNAAILAKQKADKDAADAYARDVARIKAENAKAQALYAQQQADYRAAVAAQQAEAARIQAANAAAQAKYQADLAKAEACRKGDKTKCK